MKNYNFANKKDIKEYPGNNTRGEQSRVKVLQLQ